jgi:SAM-dependent methyltransferase
MAITLSPQDYATAFRILATTARHPELLRKLLAERIVPKLPPRPTLLDVGSGSGMVVERLAPLFSSITMLEPNPAQIAGFQHEKAKIFLEPLERHPLGELYDVVLCSHVMYHVPLVDWGSFIDRLLAFVRPGGSCLILMASGRGPTYDLCRDFTDTLLFSERVAEVVQRKQVPHEVVPLLCGFSTKTYEEMYTLCRFFVFEASYTAEQVAAMSQDEARGIDERIRVHTERCRSADGLYRLWQDEDLVIIPKPAPATS